MSEHMQLLEALKSAVQVLTWAQWSGKRRCIYCGCHDTEPHIHGCWLYDELQKARSAIAAAEGAEDAPKQEGGRG